MVIWKGRFQKFAKISWLVLADTIASLVDFLQQSHGGDL